MEKTKEYSEAVAEALEVLQKANEDVIKKIPVEVIQQMNKNKSQTYKAKFSETKQIKEADLSAKTKAILAFLYRDYICPEEERAEINKMLYENEQEAKKENLEEIKKDENIEETKEIKIEKEADKSKKDIKEIEKVEVKVEDDKTPEKIEKVEPKEEKKKEETKSKEFVNVLPAEPKKSLIRRIIENFFFYDDET